MPSEIEWKLAELGAVINPPETAKLYAPLQEKEPYQGIKVTRDLKYGPDDRHALDVFVSEQAASVPRPVLMFVHGGAFTGGNKRGPDNSPFYDNIGLFAARNGIVASTSPTGWRRNINGPPAPRTSAPPCAGWAPTSPPTAAIRRVSC